METVPPEAQIPLPLETAPPVAADWKAQVPSVSQLTRRIRGQLENSFFDVWVRGEISNFRKPVSGHAYFGLKDATAQLRAVMFRTSLARVKFQLADGQEVLLHGKITVYEARGEYQMVCDAVEPVGVGALQLAFEQLKERLFKEGLFDAKAKKALPRLPRRIGVVTSSTGAAVRDILKVLQRRYPNLHVILLPASVQGEKAAPEIVAAIDLAERWNQEKTLTPIEVLIVGRGGGSLEDLWPFNEEIVARRIFRCAIPIVSAVGHEIDFTIADFVADVRAPTPSAAAEMVVPNKEDLVYQVKTRTDRLLAITLRRLEQWRLHLGHLAQRLIDPRQKIKRMRETFLTLEKRMTLAMGNRCLLSKGRLEKAAEMLHSLSPLQVVARGYSITRSSDGSIVRHVRAVSPGQLIFSWVGDGTVESVVKGVQPDA